MSEKKKSSKAKGSISASKLVDPNTTILGAMLLEKTKSRSETQYFYFSNKWDELRTLFFDPVGFFKTVTGSQDESLTGPVTAVIKPISSDLDAILEKIRFLALSVSKSKEDSAEVRISVDKFDKALMGSENGWYVAQYANLTGFLEIYYLSPSRGTKPNGYAKGFTPFVVCNIGNRPFSTEVLCQMHFDLNTKSDGSDLAQSRADFIVDFLQDKGKSICDWVDGNLDMKHTDIKAVLTGTPKPTKPKKGKFQKGRFKTRYVGSSAPDGPTLTVEKLSVSLPTKTAKGETIQYFVCSQSAGTYIGDFDSGTVNVEMGNTVIKIYQQPVGP